MTADGIILLHCKSISGLLDTSDFCIELLEIGFAKTSKSNRECRINFEGIGEPFDISDQVAH